MSGAARGFYAALGIDLPDRPGPWVSVSCISADHDDRRPSCGINLDHGGFACKACGAKGSAYDAAVLVGRPSRDAAALCKRHGLGRWEDTGREPRAARRRSEPPKAKRRPRSDLAPTLGALRAAGMDVQTALEARAAADPDRLAAVAAEVEFARREGLPEQAEWRTRCPVCLDSLLTVWVTSYERHDGRCGEPPLVFCANGCDPGRMVWVMAELMGGERP